MSRIFESFSEDFWERLVRILDFLLFFSPFMILWLASYNLSRSFDSYLSTSLRYFLTGTVQIPLGLWLAFLYAKMETLRYSGGEFENYRLAGFYSSFLWLAFFLFVFIVLFYAAVTEHWSDNLGYWLFFSPLNFTHTKLSCYPNLRSWPPFIYLPPAGYWLLCLSRFVRCRNDMLFSRILYFPAVFFAGLLLWKEGVVHPVYCIMAGIREYNENFDLSHPPASYFMSQGNLIRFTLLAMIVVACVLRCRSLSRSSKD